MHLCLENRPTVKDTFCDKNTEKGDCDDDDSQKNKNKQINLRKKKVHRCKRVLLSFRSQPKNNQTILQLEFLFVASLLCLKAV